MPNRLATESSPYLRQHWENPVDWYPWGPEAFERARAEAKPILLSVGYAACHWCHVMAHESFADEDTAALMNTLFVNVKVDREERPDVDAIYMQAVQALTGHGGWPMTVVLTPDGTPYWGGTYFPPDDRMGMPSFRRVIQAVANAYQEQPDAIARTTEAIRALYDNRSSVGSASGAVDDALLQRAFTQLAARFDHTHGGFLGAPKFPQTMALDFCLRYHARTTDADEKALALEVVHRSFLAMGRGGLFDQIGGGFARYSTDERWLVPHFEKMLYDNALLVRLGVHLWQVTRDDEVRRITEATIGWLIREMTLPNGGFASSLDADSEGEEGKFYLWSTEELDTLLGDDAAIARAYWGVQAGGNFEGRSILHVPVAPDLVVARLGISDEALRHIIERSAATLLAARQRRVRPGLDEKVLAGWNGLMTRALADAARAWHNDEYAAVAVRNARLLRDRLVDKDGRVTRVLRPGKRGERGVGFLEDQAAVALAFHAVQALTHESQWFEFARRIARSMRRHFHDPSAQCWFDTADDAEALIARPRELYDNATPSGMSLAMELELWLDDFMDVSSARAPVLAALEPLAEPMGTHPNAFGNLLGVAQLALDGPIWVLLIGELTSSTFLAMSSCISETYLPRVMAVAGGNSAAVTPSFGRESTDDELTYAYVCKNSHCERPVTDPAALLQAIAPLAAT